MLTSFTFLNKNRDFVIMETHAQCMFHDSNTYNHGIAYDISWLIYLKYSAMSMIELIVSKCNIVLKTLLQKHS